MLFTPEDAARLLFWRKDHLEGWFETWSQIRIDRPQEFDYLADSGWTHKDYWAGVRFALDHGWIEPGENGLYSCTPKGVAEIEGGFRSTAILADQRGLITLEAT